MNLNRFGTFTLGVIITAVSVGAVSYANAAGDASIKSCANKQTGVMRYISKGSCKKNEKPLSWNQIGPQGLVGPSGLNGADGLTGTKGEDGNPGLNGADGRGWLVVDSTGKVLGDYVSYVPSGTGGASGLSSSIVFVRDELIFQAITTQEDFISTGGILGLYFSSNLISRQPFAWTGFLGTKQETLVLKSAGNFLDGVYRTIGEPNLFTGAEIYNSSGRLLTALESRGQDSQGRWMRVEKIIPPTYTAPLKIVAK